MVCGLCGQRLTFCSSTTTMRYHLERKHPMQWALGSNVKDIAIDPVTGESLSTVVISEELDPRNFPTQESVDSPTTTKRRAKAKKNLAQDNALVPIESQASQPGHSGNNYMQLTNRPSTVTLNSTKNTAITYFITEMLVRDLLPLKEIENTGFKQLMNYLEPTYSLPCRETVLQSLSRLYQEVKPGVAQTLGSVDHLSLTMDIWTSATFQLFVTLTAYWVTDEWSLANRVLSTSSLQVGYTVEDLGTRINDTLNDYGIMWEKVSAIVHSDPENWAMEICGIPAVTCFAFTLQEATKKALDLPPINRLISGARKLVGSVKHLSGSIVELSPEDPDNRVSEIKMEQDIMTRWFTTYAMLKLLHEQRSVLCAVVGNEDMEKASNGVLGQNSEQWDLLGEIVRILHPLQTATEVISGEKNVSLSSVFPILHGLTSVHLCDRNEDSAPAKLFKQVIRSEIMSRWKLDSIEAVETVPVIASVLDPRYRDPLYLSVEQRANIKDSLLKVMSSHCPKDPERIKSFMDTNQSENGLPAELRLGGNPAKLNFSALEFLLGRHILMDQPNQAVNSEAEFKLYMDNVMNPPANTDSSPYSWWQGNRQRFPNLAGMAKRFLCIPSTSSSPEKLFREDGMLYNSSRAQLEPDCVDFILFLNSNITHKKK